VEQEEGYISPVFSSPQRLQATVSSLGRPVTPDNLSSPLQLRKCLKRSPFENEGAIMSTPTKHGDLPTNEPLPKLCLGISPSHSSDGRITSPPTASQERFAELKTLQVDQELNMVLPSSGDTQQSRRPIQDVFSVNLRDIFIESTTSDAEQTSSSSFIIGRRNDIVHDDGVVSDDIIDDCEARLEADTQLEERQRLVAAGWARKFSNATVQSKGPSLVVVAQRKRQVTGHGPKGRQETIRTLNNRGFLRQPRANEHAFVAVQSATNRLNMASGNLKPDSRAGHERRGSSPDLSSPPCRVTLDNSSTGKPDRIAQLRAFQFR